jgi:hypothetical protein
VTGIRSFFASRESLEFLVRDTDAAIADEFCDELHLVHGVR